MAPTHRLVLEIDPADALDLAAGGARLVLAQPAGSAPPNLVWLALRPAALTTIGWDETRGVYAADAPLRDGAALAVRCVVHPARDRKVYSFGGSRFAEPLDADRIPRGHYDVVNDAPSAAAFGLVQPAWVNGARLLAAVNAIVLPPAFRAGFAAATRVYVWAQPAVAAGCVAPNVPPGAAAIGFEHGQTSKRYRYDRASGTFVPR